MGTEGFGQNVGELEEQFINGSYQKGRYDAESSFQVYMNVTELLSF